MDVGLVLHQNIFAKELFVKTVQIAFIELSDGVPGFERVVGQLAFELMEVSVVFAGDELGVEIEVLLDETVVKVLSYLNELPLELVQPTVDFEALLETPPLGIVDGNQLWLERTGVVFDETVAVLANLADFIEETLAVTEEGFDLCLHLLQAFGEKVLVFLQFLLEITQIKI